MNDITLLAVGDIILDPTRHARAFDHVRALLKSADITFANCDQVYSDLGESPNGFWPIQVGAPPHGEAMLGSLAAAGFKVLGFGNNHSLDWGYDGLLACLAPARRYRARAHQGRLSGLLLCWAGRIRGDGHPARACADADPHSL